MKRSRSGRSFALATLLLSAASSLSVSAFAKDDKKKKDHAADHKGGLMEEGGKDPAETETMDEDGAFVPGKKKKAAHPAAGDVGEGETEAGGAGDESNSEKKDKEPEPEKKKPPAKLRKTVGVFGEALIGFGDAPVPGPANANTGKSTSFGFLLGGHYDVSTELRLMLRVPWTTGTIQDLNAKDKSSSALGLPEIAARYRLTDPGSTEWALRVAVGIPVAQGNPDVTNPTDTAGVAQGNVQRVADAANGWHDPELYAMKRVPISPALTFGYRDEKFRLGSELKAIFMPKVGGSITQPTNASGGTTEMKGLGISVLLGGTASYEVLERKFLALAAWATYQVAQQVEYTSSATAPSPFQFVLEPRILAQFGHFVPSAGFLIPVGGQLGGHINGVRIRVEAVF
ncbi:MAG TPA: hypothetical protein VF395_17060 [Polyangiaceae bacterium]